MKLSSSCPTIVVTAGVFTFERAIAVRPIDCVQAAANDIAQITAAKCCERINAPVEQAERNGGHDERSDYKRRTQASWVDGTSLCINRC
jgi:hypothetical protein